MTINFNSYNTQYNKPLMNISGFKAVEENKKNELKNETPKQTAHNTDLAQDLDNISTFNKANVKTTQEVDSQSAFAVSCFESIVQSYEFSPEELVTLYRQFNLQISNLAPTAKQQLDDALHSALFNAFSPVVTMDDQSQNAIANFKSTINAGLTRDEMVELFVRFSREISINYPEAWKELESVLGNMIAEAFQADTSMDVQSRNVISNFKSTVNPQLTRDEMVELFVRFSREISINYPEAWKELSGILANSLANAYVPNNTMDAQSKNAITNFKSTVNPQLTKDEMIELFVRFSREISINFPEAWKQLEGALSQQLPNAFKPVTTIDQNSKDVASVFVDRVALEKLSSDELEAMFGEFLKLISLQHVDAKKKIEYAYQNTTKKAENKDKQQSKEVKNSDNVVQFFREVVEKVNDLDEKVRNLGAELANADDRYEINNKLGDISKIEGQKDTLDSSYNGAVRNINDNQVAQNKISDDYKTSLDVSKDRPDDKNLQEKEMKQLTRWDMLREMRRKEVLGILEDEKKDDLVEQLSAVPKFILKKILLNQVHDQQCEILMQQKYPEALLRHIPKSNAKKQLPKAEDMLPILMMTGNLSSGQNGIDLIKGTMMGDFKAETSPNPTRAREEIIPFIADMLLNKPPKAADALKATANVGKPRPESLNNMVKADINKLAEGKKDLVGDFLGLKQDKDEVKQKLGVEVDPENMTAGRRDNKIDMSDENENRLPRLEMLSIGQLLELARDKVDEFTDDQAKDNVRAKRGTNKEACEFLEALDGVNSLADAKLAVAVLYNHQQEILKQAVLPNMDEADMVKLTMNFGKSKEEMVKDMPWYTIQDQIKDLPKIQMMNAFQMLDKSEMIGAFKQLPSQVIASIAFDAVDRNTVSQNLLNQKGFAAA